MPQPSIVSDYLDALSRELSFDLVLANRVRTEVEDHLWEAVAAAPADDQAVAQRRAIESFGQPREIASQMTAVSLMKRTKQAGVNVLAALGGIFVVMELRTAWFVRVQGDHLDRLMALRNAASAIDRSAFLLSAAIAIAVCLYARTRRVAATFNGAWRAQLRWCSVLFIVATAALAVSVASDALLTFFRLAGVAFSASIFVPLSLVAVEMVCAAVLISRIYKTAQSISSAASLLRT